MFSCPTCSSQLVREGKLYQCVGCAASFSQFEVCFGSKPPTPSTVPEQSTSAPMPRYPPPVVPPHAPPGTNEDGLQPSRVPKKPYPPPDAAAGNKLALPKPPEDAKS